MNVDFIREFCLNFPKAKETLQWGETLCFKIAGSKIFAMLSLDAVPPTLTLKTDPEQFAELLEQEGIVPARYVGRYKWVTLERLDVLPRHELEALITTSYSMVAQSLPKKKKLTSKRKPKAKR
ncbi:MAG TPA: MmcQ/YjbR family DNA-binding protein [Terriglobales bacterium]|nr:MmcQ/YjbR family DNA-binding protein [Terriglobales bacterium]